MELAPPFVITLFAVFLIVFLWDEFYGFLLLMGGFILFDRNFAYAHVPIGSLPLYITEFCLLVWSVRTLAIKRTSLLQEWSQWPLSIRAAWSLYAIAGGYSLLRGLLHFPSAAVLRDFALCYYSVVMLLVGSMEWTEKRLRHMMLFLGGLVGLRSLSIISLNTLETISPSYQIQGQPAAISLNLAIALLFLFSLLQFRIHVLAMLGAILAQASVVILLVRSAWTGLTIGLVTAFYLLSHQISIQELIKRVALTFVLLTLGTYVIMTAVPVLWTHVQRTESVQSPVAKRLSPTPAPRATAPPARVPATPPPAQVRPHPPAVITTSPVSKPDVPVSPVRNEFNSLFRGFSSENVMTRLWMWRDAIMEIFGIGLFSPNLRIEDFKHYNLPPRMIQPDAYTHTIEIFPSGFPQKNLYLKTTRHVDSRFPPRHLLQVAHHVFFGIPFGKPFLPPEIVWILNSPNRFDPHNSLLAIFYRTGLFGLLSFAGLSWMCLCRAFAFARAPAHPFAPLSTALSVSVLYFLIHSLTDNTLENSFKGVWYWSLLGLIVALVKKERTDIR